MFDHNLDVIRADRIFNVGLILTTTNGHGYAHYLIYIFCNYTVFNINGSNVWSYVC